MQVWTYEKYCKLPDDGQRYEVIDGNLHVSPSPWTSHQVLSKRLMRKLYQLELAGRGFAFNAPLDLIMPGCTPVQPDLMMFTAEQAAVHKERFLEGVPLLIVEILSPTTAGYDRVTKLNRYARSGVRHYWLVDDGFIQLHELVDGQYRVSQSLAAGESFEFLGLHFDLNELFAPVPGAACSD